MSAVPLQSTVTQSLRHEGACLVQLSSSRLSSFTQLQRCDVATTRATDASGAPVTLSSRWEGAVWVVLSRADASAGAAPSAPIETRRWLEDASGLTMRFDVSTIDASSGARVTARRRLLRSSWECEEVPTPEEAAAGRTVPGSAWSMLFGSAQPDGSAQE
jgi:hypothetical protein